MTTEPVPRFPFPSGPFGDEPSQYQELRSGCPFTRVRLRSGHEATLLLRYHDVAVALSDERMSRAPADAKTLQWTRASSIFTDAVSMANHDGPEHMRQRRVIAAVLSLSKVRSWAPLIRDIADTLLDKVREQEPVADLMETFFRPYPVRIICRLLDIPFEDSPRFRDWSEAFLSAMPHDENEEKRTAHMVHFSAYVRELIDRKRAQPGHNILDMLITSHDEGGRLTEDELVYNTLQIISAGTGIMTNLFSRIVLMLLRDERRLWDRVAAHGEVTPGVVEELLRYVQQGNGAMVRVAQEDVELPSGTITAGQTVLLPLSSTGLDETVFPEPHTLRFDREGPRSLIFSGGPHYCLGTNLAKAELRIGLQSLMTRLPGLRLACDPAQLHSTDGELLDVLKELPITW
jgi:cytochrome P450